MAIWTRSPEDPARTADVEQLEATVAGLRADLAGLATGYDRLVMALRSSGATLVVHDEHGREVFSNLPAVVDQEGDSVVLGHNVARALERAVAEPVVERHDLIGPPARSVQVRANRLDARGGLIGTVAVLDDTTEAVRLEQLRRELVVNVGHELRTPVGALGVLAETLVDEIEATNPELELVLRMARRIEAETIRLASLVNDVLELAAAHDVTAGLVRVEDLVTRAVGRVATAADVAGIELLVDPIDPALVIAGERSKLVSALYNLLDNAVKYSDRGSLVRTTVRADQHEVWIDVTDEGLGIAPRDRSRVFDRYFRADRARSRDTGGSGLGLAIVQEIVTAHLGDVALRSVEGQGSTFTIRLPRNPSTTEVVR